MPTGKRASMREGPLAALFRKTAEDAPGAEKSEETRAAEKREEAPGSPEQQGALEPQQPAAPEYHPREHLPPAPGAEPRVEEPRIPSPQERLRQAFSSDIPQSLLERPAPEPPQPPARDPYVRRERLAEPYAPPVPTGTPVIRVVGVGGAGVNAVNRMVEAEIEGVEFLAINTDLQSLQLSAAHETLHIGDSVTKG